MKIISVVSLLDKQKETLQLIDLRAAKDFAAGSIPGAVNIPMQELKDRRTELAKDRPVYLFCYSGKKSPEYAQWLEEQGYDAVSVEGGYRAWLCLQLEKWNLESSEEQLAERRAKIERSIIKKFRKPIWSNFTKALTQYELLKEGDKVAVCISGGKDSMLLAKLFQELHKYSKYPFEVVYLCMNPGYSEENWKIIENNAKLLGIPLTVFHSEIFQAVTEVGKNPCYMCARMRRGFLYTRAKELGCNKIALGHHFDDVIETILMGMLYAGKIETMMPKLHSQNFEGMELIRPLYLVKEADVCAWRNYNDLHFIQCACRFTEENATGDDAHLSKRSEMKDLITAFRAESEDIEKNIFKSVTNVNLERLIGYHKGAESYHFLDDYDA